MVSVRCVGGTPYAEAILSAVGREFPLAHSDNESRVDAVAAEFVGSRQIRQGPAPRVESLAAIRSVIRACIDESRPIPVLVPAGPKKWPTDVSIDVGELAMLRQLECLQQRVLRHHPEGVQVTYRPEDNVGRLLEGRTPGALEAIERYLGDLEKLAQVLRLGFFTVRRESELIKWDTFQREVHEVLPPLVNYIETRDLIALSKLHQLGWIGDISLEHVQFHLERNAKFHPGLSAKESQGLVAQYFACILARRRLGGSGADPRGSLQVAFMPPEPGAPRHLNETRVYYRTVPMNHSRRHLQPWGGKGILRVHESNEVTMAMVPWGEDLELEVNYLEFTEAGETVQVQADYELVD